MAEQNGAWHDTLTLISDLSSVNKRIATFVLRVLDADAGGGEPPSPAAGQALGARLIDLGHVLRDRALEAGGVPAPQGEPCGHRREPHTPWTGGRSAIYVADN